MELADVQYIWDSVYWKVTKLRCDCIMIEIHIQNSTTSSFRKTRFLLWFGEEKEVQKANKMLIGVRFDV